MIAHVALPKSIWHPFSYVVPKEWEGFIVPLQRVLVPFREKKKIGYVLSLEEGEGNDLKEIIEPIDFFPLIPQTIGRLIEWIRDNFLIPHGILLKYALSEFIKLDEYLILDSRDHAELKGISLKKASQRFGKRRIFSLLKEGRIILKDACEGKILFERKNGSESGSITKTVYIGSFENRVNNYFQKIDEALGSGRSCLFFVPPYNQSGGIFFKLLTERYGERVIWYGRERGRKERVRTYVTLREKTGFIVVSNILGLFLPVSGLGLIIIERPEDESYMINRDFSISVPECAIKRAEIEDVSLFIGTCSPTLSIFRDRNEFDWRDELDLPSSTKIIESPGLKSTTRSLLQLKSYVKTRLAEKKKIAIFFPFGGKSERIRCLNCNRILVCDACGFATKWVEENESLLCERCKKIISSKFECPFCKTNFLTKESTLLNQFKALIEQEGIEAITIRDIQMAHEGSQTKESSVILGQKSLSYAYGLKVDELILVAIERLKSLWSYKAYERLHQLIMNLKDSLKPEVLIFYGSRLDPKEMDYLLSPRELYVEELRKRTDLDLPPLKRLVLLKLERKKGIAGSKEKLYEYLKKHHLMDHIFGEKFQDLGDLKILKVLLRGLESVDLNRLFPFFSISGLKILVDPEVI